MYPLEMLCILGLLSGVLLREGQALPEHSGLGSLTISGAQHMDLVHLEDTVTGSCVSRQCVENLHNNMEIEESMLRQKHCEPIKNLPAITICDRKCCSFVNRELPFIKICPERGRYRVGPFLMPRPFGIEEESLINFCMDDDLKKGEMLFQTNFYGITRNDIMSLSPRSIINMKVVSAVSELLSAETTVNVGQSKFNLFLPAYNTLQDHVGGEYRDASVDGGKFIPADLYAKSIRPWEKIFVPVNCGHGCWYMLVIVISEMRVEILDPLPASMCMHYNIAICKRLLRSIEMMLDHGGSNVNSSSLKLMDFSVDYTRQPCICSEYDCALYIMLMMERHNMRSTLNDAEVYAFLKNINNALRLENGKGLCILGDGDNGIDYAVEEFLPEATYRQCCHKVFTEMVKRFPAAPVQHLFWSACRSTSQASFYKYMDLIQQQSEECHEWLLQTNWSSWALFSIPKWVKCTSVTLSITDKLRSRLRQYLEMSIARRFTRIARLTADLFERRRMAVWNWYREKVTPTVREVIHDRTIDGQRFAMVEQNGTTLKLTDTISMFYDLEMEAMSCSCGLWQISGIPCAHACRAIQLNMGNVDEYVDNMMSV